MKLFNLHLITFVTLLDLFQCNGCNKVLVHNLSCNNSLFGCMSILIHCDSFLDNIILFLKYNFIYLTLPFTSYNNYQCWKVSDDYSLESLAQNVHCGSLLSHKNESCSCYIHHWRYRSLPRDHMTQENTSLHNSHPLNPTDLPFNQNSDKCSENIQYSTSLLQLLFPQSRLPSQSLS